MALIGILKKAIARENIFLTSLTLSTDLANNATLTGIAYPAGANQATFVGSVVGPQALVAIVDKNDIWTVAAAQVAFTFGASTISVQNLSGVTWKANSVLDLQMDAVSGSGAAALSIRRENIQLDLASVAAGTYNVDLAYSGVILAVSARVVVPVTTAAKLATLTAHINGSALASGGAIALTSANCATRGVAVAGSAITTAANSFTGAQPIGFIASAVTVFVEGQVDAQLRVSNSDLAAAISAILTN